ncbi:MAG: hypothetical protein KJO35_01190, partial [Gammaproteobacteria bacterium]|nr:hypothetical protein [Gammaproteobacteria bacterium]
MLSMRFAQIAVLGGLLLSGCAATPPATPHDMDRVAEEYVRLVLALGLHDADFVDAYHGPEKWRKEVARKKLSLAGISIESGLLRSTLSAGDFGRDTPLDAQRRELLLKQLTAVQTRADQLRGKELSFDQEARLLYDARPPRFGAEHFMALRDELDSLLPGEGS